MYRNGQRFTFNIFAFLFGLFWFTYRKMYVEALIILLAIIGESFIEELFLANSVDPGADKMISIIVTIVIATITGFLGNSLYIRHAQKSINASKEKFKDD